MPACPQCGLTEWHPPHEDAPVDEAVGIKSSQLLDEWEQNQIDLREKMLEAAELASKATSIRNSLAARGITVTSDLPVLDDEKEDEPAAPTPQASAPALQETTAAPSRVLRGVTPKKREPTRTKPVVIGDVKTAGVEHSDERASADEQREDELRAEAREAQSRGAVITFQRPVDLPANAQGSAEVADIRRAAGEDVANDSDSLSGIIAQQIAQAASANGIK